MKIAAVFATAIIRIVLDESIYRRFEDGPLGGTWHNVFTSLALVSLLIAVTKTRAQASSWLKGQQAAGLVLHNAKYN